MKVVDRSRYLASESVETDYSSKEMSKKLFGFIESRVFYSFFLLVGDE